MAFPPDMARLYENGGLGPLIRPELVPPPGFGEPADLEFGSAGSPGVSDEAARADHVHGTPAAPDVSGKQDKIPKGDVGGHALLDTMTDGLVGKSLGVLNLIRNLTVGAAATYTGGVNLRASGEGDATITGPSGGAATLQPGVAEVNSNKITALAATEAAASDVKYPSEKAVVAGLVSLRAEIPDIPDISGLAPKASPAFTGIPTAPTADVGTDTTQIATTAFVQAAVPDISGKQDKIPAVNASTLVTYSETEGVFGQRTLTTSVANNSFVPTNVAVYNALALKANLASPAFTGTPTAPTAVAGTDTIQIATTAFVQAAVPDISGKQDKIPAGTAGQVLTYSGVAGTVGSKAIDTTPTASSANLITSGGVKAAIPDISGKEDKANKVTALSATSTDVQYPSAKAVYAAIAAIPAAPDISGLAPKASPALTGTPTAPTANAGTNTTQIATTAFVQAALPSVPDISGLAPKASPALTGTPTAPTAGVGTDTDQIATTAFVKAAIKAEPAAAASLSFMSADDLIYAVLPPGIATGYVTSSWADVSASMALQIALASGTSFASLSANSGSPTNLSSYAGQAVKFKALNMASSATQAVFGLRFDA